jgi:hypothetical protein
MKIRSYSLRSHSSFEFLAQGEANLNTEKEP